MDHQFRSATFGGFNRQDVMDYLERSVAEQRRVQDDLRAQLEQVKNELNQTKEQLAQTQEQAQQFKLQAEQAAAESGRLREQAAAVVKMREEMDQLRGRIAQLEPDAAAYAAIKERTSGIELEAHRRAQTIVDAAQSQADQVRRELAAWLERVERDYFDLRAQVGNTAAQATNELERVRQGLGNITLCMTNQHSALERLIQSAKNDPTVQE